MALTLSDFTKRKIIKGDFKSSCLKDRKKLEGLTAMLNMPFFLGKGVNFVNAELHQEIMGLYFAEA